MVKKAAPDPEALDVLDGGLQTTVQDEGRVGLGSLGLGRGGALDLVSLHVANALAGNAAGSAALEATISGPVLRARRAVTIGVAGADLGLVVDPGGRPVVPPAAIQLTAGETLTVTGAGGPTGARVYLAPAGGIDVPLVLGSRSTFLPAGFGGLDGRAIRAGDVLTVGRVTDGARVHASVHIPDPAAASGPIRVRPGPAASAALRRALDTLAATGWSVDPDSDRRGLRLRGTGLPGSTAAGPSHGVVPGTVQLTPDGTPLVLLADAGPTGGYPVVAVVIRADLDRLGQLRPGGQLRFEVVSARAAVAAERSRRAGLDDLNARLGRRGAPPPTDAWDDLAGAAGS